MSQNAKQQKQQMEILFPTTWEELKSSVETQLCNLHEIASKLPKVKIVKRKLKNL